MEVTYFKFENVLGRLWGWTRFLRARGASEQRLQFPSYTNTLYCLPYISCYYLTLSAISDHTLHCTVWKYYYSCKTIDRLDTFISRQIDKYFRLLRLVRIFQCPMCQTVGLWQTFTRTSLAALARKLWPNLKPIPLAFVVRYGGDLFQIWKRTASVVRLD